LKQLGNLVAAALKDEGWASVDKAKIDVQDKSGQGGSKTYKVTGGPGAHPCVVALHLRSEEVTADPESEKRMAAAQKVLSQKGLAPKRLAMGGDWFIEPWEGQIVGSNKHLNEPSRKYVFQGMPEDQNSAADEVTYSLHKVSDKVCDHMWKVKVSVPLSWYQYFDLAKEQGGRLPTISDLERENIQVDCDCFTPIAWSGGKETGKRDGFFTENENCWANVGPRKYQIEYPAWGLQKGGGGKWKPEFFFMIRESHGPPANIQPTPEKSQEDGKGRATFEELGGLLAKIHGVSPEWYKPHKEKLCQKYKGLEEIPEGSYIWWNTARESLMPNKNNANVIRKFGKAGPQPVSDVLSRVVTCHGDFHPANILRTKDGLKVIDMEYSCATFAVQDFAFAFALYVKEATARHSFVSGYLKQLGREVTPDYVDQLVVDAECCTLGTVFGLINEHVKRASNHSHYDMKEYERIADMRRQHLTSPHRRDWLIRNGVKRS